MNDVTVTRGELAARSRAYARALSAMGVRRGTRLAVLSHNDPAVIVTMLAAYRIGATWLPANPRDTAERLVRVLAKMRCDALVFHSDLLPVAEEIVAAAPSLRAIACLDDDSDLAPSLPALAVGEPEGDLIGAEEDDMAAIYATSGSTGEPKGVAFSYDTMATILQLGAETYCGHTMLLAGPLTHATGRACLGLVAGGGTGIIPDSADPQALVDAVERWRVTLLAVVPTVLNRILLLDDLAERDLSSLQLVGLGAAPSTPELLRQAIAAFGPIVTQGYGQTEAPLFVASMAPEDMAPGGQPASEQRLRSCGRATKYSEIRILDPTGAELPAGTMGEIAVAGDFLMDQYLDDQRSTDALRVGRFQRTGDLGFVDDEGFLTITGRAKEMIISGGFNVFPAEVERALDLHPDVFESCVVGVPDEEWGEVVAAVLVPAAGAVIDFDDLRTYARRALGGVKAPKRYVVVDAIPRNHVNKVVRGDLKGLFETEKTER
jgi:acyl-CoA synthetase (AMP-forming)/AMP-acid ligase II